MRKRARQFAVVALTLASGLCLADEAFRDPTRPYTAVEQRATASPRFVVSAIIVSEDRRVAIVNGRRVGVGSSLSGARVISIEKDQLTLDLDGKRVTARLN